MQTLHILQGGVDNGDKSFLERAARENLTARSWVVPKSAAVGDDVIIYIRGQGLFATARIQSPPKPRSGWFRRYGSRLDSIKLIKPAIPLASIQARIPALTWALYPRSITTPTPRLAVQVRKLIDRRGRRSNESTTKPFVEAFGNVRSEMTDRELRMLEAHFLAPNHEITSIDLARAAGYPTFRPANAVYSNLGGRLRRALRRPRRGQEVLAAVFVDFSRTPDNSLWVFALKPPVVSALTELGWFDESESDGLSDSSLVTKVAREGHVGIMLRTHRHREQSLRRTKLRDVWIRKRRLICEVPGCGFDFWAQYGSLGKGFAEVHHLIPLAHNGPRETRLTALAVVCSNCHRMIHRDGGCRTLQEIGRSMRPNTALHPTAPTKMRRRG